MKPSASIWPRTVGINAVAPGLRRAGEIDYLLVERYDRLITDGEGAAIARLHQEDFCQALGVAPEQKYQNEGGPSFRQSFELVRSSCTVPARELIAFFDAAVFNYLIGNNDAHGKNFSLLYVPSGSGALQVRLAPLYDLICTAAYPALSKKMAMKIGGEYNSDKVFPEHFDRMAEEAGLTKRYAREHIRRLSELVVRNLDDVSIGHRKAEGVIKIVRDNVLRTLRRLR